MVGSAEGSEEAGEKEEDGEEEDGEEDDGEEEDEEEDGEEDGGEEEGGGELERISTSCLYGCFGGTALSDFCSEVFDESGVCVFNANTGGGFFGGGGIFDFK